MAVLLSVVLGLLVYPVHVTGLTLCGTDGMLEVVENATDNVFTCTGIDSSYTVYWIHKAGDMILARCPPRTTMDCTNYLSPYFTASRPDSDTSTLTLDGSTVSLDSVRGYTIICKTSSITNSQQTECRADVVAVPSVTCYAHFNTWTSSPWTVTVNCSVSRAYSYFNRYTCQLDQTSPSTKNLGSVNMSLTSGSEKYKSGTCEVTVPFPDVTGVYSYKMLVTPGKKHISARIGDQNIFYITSTSSDGAQSSFSVGTVIGVTVAVALLIMILVVVVVVVWLWRRDWVLPCAEANRITADDEMGHGERTDMQQFHEEVSGDTTGVYELQDPGEPNTPVDLNPVPSEYDLLQRSDVGLKSVYSSLTLSDNTTGATGDTASSYVNNSETSSVCVNKDNSKPGAVYVNKDNQETSSEYVNKDNPEAI